MHCQLLYSLFLLFLFLSVGVVLIVDMKEKMRKLKVDHFLHLQMIDVFDLQEMKQFWMSVYVTPLGLSCWHMSLMYLYSAIYDSCELIMYTTSSLDAHTGHFHYLDT